MSTSRKGLRLLVGVVSLVVSGCVSGKTYDGPWIHRSLFGSGRALPARVLLLPPRVVAGTRDEHGTFTRDAEASRRLAEELELPMGERLTALGLFEPVPAPALDDAERANLEAHQELFAIVARAASQAGNGGSTPAFKLREFDYTLGPGLAGLAREGGAGTGLLVMLQGYALVAGLVDLASGDLLWVQRSVFFDDDVEGALLASFERLWDGYPGLEAYARVRRES